MITGSEKETQQLINLHDMLICDFVYFYYFGLSLKGYTFGTDFYGRSLPFRHTSILITDIFITQSMKWVPNESAVNGHISTSMPAHLSL